MPGSKRAQLLHLHRRGPRKRLLELLERNKEGLNVGPHADDGWEAPPPVALADGSRVGLHKDGETLRRSFDAIAAARSRVCFEFYIWDDDATGRAFADLLEKKARQGVKVFVIYDGYGVLGTNDRRMFQRLRRVGARVAEFHPIRPWETRFGWRPMSRDHRKIVVADNNVAVVGGLNVADAYAGSWIARNDLKTVQLWRDTGMSVEGPAARMFIEAFARNWDYVHRGGRIDRAAYFAGVALPRSPKGRRVGKARERAADPAPKVKPDSIGVMATVPTLTSPLRPMLHDLLNGAKKSVHMTMAYFAPDDELIESLCAAARRGADVRLIFGAKSDLPIMVIAARAFYERLLCAGVKIYERQHVVLHAKTLCVDDELSIIGSTNLDYRSIELNCEIAAVVRSREFAAQAQSLFEHDLQHAREVKLDEWRTRHWRDRFVQWLVSRVRYLL
ncbi:MAG TPA: phospholipase D-like domain-containing protein [Tepidisphaeraceae bacterium]|jgi:cardiolipin synthase